MNKIMTPIAITLSTILILGIGTVIYQQEASAQSISRSQLELEVSGQQAGTNNTANAVIIDTINKDSISVVAQAFNVSTGATDPFASDTITVSVSTEEDGTYITADSVNAGTGTAKGLTYSPTTKSTTLVINPMDFRFVQVSVAALGVNESSTLTWSAK